MLQITVEDQDGGLLDLTDATLGGGFGTILFRNSITNIATDDPTTILGSDSTILVALDGATGENSLILAEAIDLGNATLELTFENDAEFTLGETFVFFMDDEDRTGLGSAEDSIAGSFGDFVGFDLAGDLAFSLVENGEPGQVQSLSLVVVTDAEAIAGGFIDAPTVSSSPTGVSDSTQSVFPFDGLDLRGFDLTEFDWSDINLLEFNAYIDQFNGSEPREVNVSEYDEFDLAELELGSPMPLEDGDLDLQATDDNSSDAGFEEVTIFDVEHWLEGLLANDNIDGFEIVRSTETVTQTDDFSFLQFAQPENGTNLSMIDLGLSPEDIFIEDVYVPEFESVDTIAV